jgi:hypothetical protein
MNSEKHCRKVRGENSSEKFSKYFVKSNFKLDEIVCAAECTLAFHTVAQWRTEVGRVGFTTPTPPTSPPKFRSFTTAEPNSQFRGIYVHP